MSIDVLQAISNAVSNWQPPQVPEDIPQGDMPGDKVWIGPMSIEKANVTFRAMLPMLKEALEANPARKAVITVTGGSGVGKTCVSALLTYYLNQLGVGAFTMSGDNYPRRFPELNDMERMRIFRLAGVRGMLAAGVYSPEHAATLKQLQQSDLDPSPEQCEKYPWLAAYQKAGREELSKYLGTELEQEYDQLETRLAQLHRLEKKYAADEAGLIAILEESRRALEDIEYADEKREKLTGELAKKRETAYNAAKGLSKKRAAAAKELQKRIREGLSELSMPSVRFLVEITPKAGEPGFDDTGCDEVRFLMSANAGETPGRISKIASGGELARIMLVMKDVLSERDAVGTLVFDEIDEGVSGIAAQRVAEKLAHISRRKQVICVTHLPQIAAMADTHFHIEKRERGGRTYTAVTPLEREGRIREIARLHGGDNITDITLASAAEQLDAAEKYKQEGMG